jgi:head-tail adaptor
MANVSKIAAQAFDMVAASISDAVHDATLNGSESGRVVFGGETAPNGFPMAEAKEKVRQAHLEGFATVAAIGDTVEANSVTYHVLAVRDAVEAGGLVVARVLSADDMTWLTATFERLDRISDGAGGYYEDWAAISGLDGVSVGMVGMSGAEYWASMRVEAESKWQLWVKSDVGITEVDRVTVAGRTYNITFVNNVEKRGVWQVVHLDEGTA